MYTPAERIPLAIHLNYGRAVTSQDARGMALDPAAPKVAATDFYMVGTSHHLKRFSLSTDMFLINRQHEDVYDPDNGTMQYQGPSRSYGWEAKTSVQLNTHLSWNAGITQVSNAFFLGHFATPVRGQRAPHGRQLQPDAASWKGLYSSLRYRHISRYLLTNPDDTSVPPAPPLLSSATPLPAGWT